MTQPGPATTRRVDATTAPDPRRSLVLVALLAIAVGVLLVTHRSGPVASREGGPRMDGWHAYDYRSGIETEPRVNMFNPALRTRDGVRVDDRLWSIDDPESPKSVLALVRYEEWEVRDGRIDTTRTPGDDLTDTTVCFDLRGDLDLKGGYVTFWVMSSATGQRWHHNVPLEAPNEWTEQRVDTSGGWHNSWRWSPRAKPNLVATLAHGNSYGIGFVGFGDEEPTGHLGMRDFRVGC